MAQGARPLEELVKELPPELQEEVRGFVHALLEKQAKTERSKPRLEWAGSLRDLRDRYTSVELQHRISGWRFGEE